MAKKKDPIAAFVALSDSEKERIWRELDGLTADELRAKSRPLSSAERKLWRTFKRRAGRPKIGKGVKVVSIGLEKNLLTRADAFAKRRGINRSALVSEALRALMGTAA
ncbi:MAG TPA: hypothetical protein VIM11_04205 [Tepidisphaeraceae bacterium]